LPCLYAAEFEKNFLPWLFVLGLKIVFKFFFCRIQVWGAAPSRMLETLVTVGGPSRRVDSRKKDPGPGVPGRLPFYTEGATCAFLQGVRSGSIDGVGFLPYCLNVRL